MFERIQTKERAYKQLELLIKRFKSDLKKGVISASHIKSSKLAINSKDGKKYSEAQIRQSYILPMFRDVLGWNTDDSVNEVIPELHNHKGYADFTFVRSGKKKFLLETKKPFLNVDPNSKSGRAALRQAIGYSRSIKDVHLTLVSNFEVLVFAHAFTMPKKGEELKNSLGWHHFTELLSKEVFDKLWEFRFENANNQDFEKQLFKNINQRIISQYKTIDKNLLNDIKNARVSIANNIKIDKKSAKNIDLPIQTLINRIIFLRSLEDRGVISDSIHSIMNKDNLWKHLGKLVDNVHKKFPISILNRTVHSLDQKGITIPDQPLKEILRIFYDRGEKFFHDCYDFKYIPSDILGYAYEHNIAYKLILKGKKFKLIKKEQYKNGVHYTPPYICTEIANTNIEKAKRNFNKKAQDLICFDIACGSGSFLTSAYDTIYSDKLKNSPKDTTLEGTRKVLPLRQRKKILESCIFGVDIDYSAVQITKLCLYLKFFENFPTSDQNKYCSTVPNLDQNIIFGDSLLDMSQKVKHPKNTIPVGIRDKKVFDLIKNKKINVIIGNPPYIKIQDLKKIPFLPESHYKKIYAKTLSTGSMEIAIGFIQRAMEILKPNGVLGYIIPNKIFKNVQGSNLRQYITNEENKCSLFQFTDFNNEQIFEASIYTCLLYLEKKIPSGKFRCCQIYKLGDPATTLSTIKKLEKNFPSRKFEIDQLVVRDLSASPWNLLVGVKRQLFLKIKNKFDTLGETAVDQKIFQGVPTGSDKVFLFQKIKEKNKTTWIMKSEAFEVISKYETKENNNENIKTTFEIEKKYLKPVFNGSADLKSFNKNSSGTYLLLPYNESGELLETASFLESKAYKFLKQTVIRTGFKNKKGASLVYGLDERKIKDLNEKNFFQYSRPQNMTLWSKEKIMIPYLAESFNAHLDKNGHFFVNVSTGGYCVLAPTKKNEKLHLLAVLNSKVFDFMVKCFSGDFRGGWMECNKHYLSAAPIPPLNKSTDFKRLSDCLKSLYKTSKAYYSEVQTPSILKQLNSFYQELEYLSEWSKKAFELTEEDCQLIEFYRSNGDDLEDEIFELHNEFRTENFIKIAKATGKNVKKVV